MVDQLTRRGFLRFVGMGVAMVIAAKAGADIVHASESGMEDGHEASNRDALLAVRRAVCSCYGPDFYGNRTACGRKLTRATVGVAHKSIPCGTLLEFYGKNGWIYARVIDRGPHVAGREFDLTEGTVKRLGYASCADFGVRTVRWRYA